MISLQLHIFEFRLLDAHLLRVATIASRTMPGAAPALLWVLLAGSILVSVVSIPCGPSHINLTRNMFQVSVSFLIICQPRDSIAYTAFAVVFVHVSFASDSHFW